MSFVGKFNLGMQIGLDIFGRLKDRQESQQWQRFRFNNPGSLGILALQSFSSQAIADAVPVGE